MAQMSALVKVLGTFFVLILIGYLLLKRRIVSESFDEDLNALMMKITLPMMLIGGFIQPFDKALTEQGLSISLVAAACLLLGFLIGLAGLKLFRVKPDRQGVWLLITTFGNLGFVGYPVIEAIYGTAGLFLASFVQITYATTFFTLGAFMMTRGQRAQSVNWRQMFLTPIMIAIEIGLFLYFTQIKLPAFVAGTLSLIGSMTGPIAMLIVGMKLSRFPLVSILNDINLYRLSLSRLLAAPIMVILMLKWLPMPANALLAPVMVIASALPGPNNAINMAITYGGDADFAARNTALSAILCLFTLPVILFLLQR